MLKNWRESSDHTAEWSDCFSSPSAKYHPDTSRSDPWSSCLPKPVLDMEQWKCSLQGSDFLMSSSECCHYKPLTTKFLGPIEGPQEGETIAPKEEAATSTTQVYLPCTVELTQQSWGVKYFLKTSFQFTLLHREKLNSLEPTEAFCRWAYIQRH